VDRQRIGCRLQFAGLRRRSAFRKKPTLGVCRQRRSVLSLEFFEYFGETSESKKPLGAKVRLICAIYGTTSSRGLPELMSFSAKCEAMPKMEQ